MGYKTVTVDVEVYVDEVIHEERYKDYYSITEMKESF